MIELHNLPKKKEIKDDSAMTSGNDGGCDDDEKKGICRSLLRMKGQLMTHKTYSINLSSNPSYSRMLVHTWSAL